MNNEIKEILQLIGYRCYCGEISEDKCEKYCNYITNLQEENEKLREEKEELKSGLDEQKNTSTLLAKRLIRAIEYIEEHSLNYNGECEIDLEVEECKDLIKILKGEK